MTEYDRGARGQRRAARLLANIEAARMRGRTQYNREDYDGADLDEPYAGGQHKTEKRRL